ncbi:RraA-like protein [Lipomyces orientalis]|uniref:RraA-like protein n=1 Tax=Lipomyces orientalis TaxID=1233043 RepID=A0ACC3TCM6_9ASCO
MCIIYILGPRSRISLYRDLRPLLACSTRENCCTMTASTDPIVSALESFSTCDVSDALLKLNHPNGGFVAGPTLWSPERQAGDSKVVGPAYTVQYVPLSDTVSPKQASHYIDLIPAGAVVFISSPKTVNAVYGGLMSTRAQASGAVGTVVDGRVRDLQEHRALGFPVFARDVGTASPYEVARVSGINVPLQVRNEGQDITVNPGDYIIADLNGVVCLPVELAEQAIALIAPQVYADGRITEDIKGGMLFIEASKKHRAALKKA